MPVLHPLALLDARRWKESQARPLGVEVTFFHRLSLTPTLQEEQIDPDGGFSVGRIRPVSFDEAEKTLRPYREHYLREVGKPLIISSLGPVFEGAHADVRHAHEPAFV